MAPLCKILYNFICTIFWFKGPQKSSDLLIEETTQSGLTVLIYSISATCFRFLYQQHTLYFHILFQQYISIFYFSYIFQCSISATYCHFLFQQHISMFFFQQYIYILYFGSIFQCPISATYFHILCQPLIMGSLLITHKRMAG